MKKLFIIAATLISFNSFAQDSRDIVLKNLAGAIQEDKEMIMYRTDFPTHCLTKLFVNLTVQSNGLIKAKMITKTMDSYGDRQILERIENRAKPFLKEINDAFGEEINILIPILASHENDDQNLKPCEITENM